MLRSGNIVSYSDSITINRISYCTVFSFGGKFIIVKILQKTIGLRVSSGEEDVGLDISEHAERISDE